MTAKRCALLVAALLLSPIAGCRPDETLQTEPASRRPAQRIVSLTPNVTEMLYAMGCGDRVVAVDTNSDHPPAVRDLPRVGGMNPSLERILAARPDAVVGSSIGRYERLASQLATRGIPFETVVADRLADVPREMERIGLTLGCSGDETLLRRLRELAAAAEDDTGAGPSVLIVASIDPLYVAGHDTFLDDLLVASGGKNALPGGVTGWPAYSLEAVLAHPPDAIWVLTSEQRWPASRELLGTSTGWRELHAVRSGRVEMLDENVATRPGPRVLDTRDLIARRLAGLAAP